MDIRRAGSTAVVGAVLAALALAPAQAYDDPEDRKREVDAAVRDLDAQVDATTAKVAAATDALNSAEAKLPPARAALAVAREAVTEAAAVEADTATRLADTIAAAEVAAQDYERTRASIESHRNAVGSMARQAYMGGGLDRLRVAMNSTTPEELTSAMAYLSAVNRSEQALLDELDTARRDLAMRRAELAATQERIEVERAAAQDAVTASQAAAAGAAAAQTEVTALVQAREAALADAEDLKAEVERRFAAMQAESDRLAKVIAERAAAAKRAAERARERAADRGDRNERTGADDRGSGLLRFPVLGPVTSSYGMRYHPILRRNKLHTGTDFGVPTGTAVKSATGGRVLESSYNSAYGNRVIVEHGIVRGVHLVTTYNHLSRSTVRPGERLDRGEVLGYSGSTGWSTGPHLHFETLEDGRFVDPMRWLR